MRFFLLVSLCAVIAAATRVETEQRDVVELLSHETPDGRSIMVNMLVRQLIEFVRNIIKNGWEQQGIPKLDPLNLDDFHLVVPAGVINLDLELEKVFATGFGGFVVHKSELSIRGLTFDIDVSVPTIDFSADKYNLIGDLFTAVPLYGYGKAVGKIEGFRFQAKIYLMQSEDGKSVVIDRIENAAFVLPTFKFDVTGAIGGGDIDGIVSAVAEEVIFEYYLNRFQGAISKVAAKLVKAALNPLLNELDTWRFIAPLLPRT